MMQDLVGIVRVEERDAAGAREASPKLKARAAKAGITGNREYNTGWHTALDLDNLLTISEIIARAASSARKAAAHTSATIIRTRARSGASTICASPRAPTGGPSSRRVPVMPLTDEMKQVIEENK